MDARLLSPRVRAVYVELLRGRSEKEIAGSLGISVHTVHNNVKWIYVRAGVHSRAELMALCIYELQCELQKIRSGVVAEIGNRRLTPIV